MLSLLLRVSEKTSLLGSSVNRGNGSPIASENVVRPASCYGVYSAPIGVRNSPGSKLSRRTRYGGAERRAADPGTSGHRRPRQLERGGARGAGQVLFTTDPGRRC